MKFTFAKIKDAKSVLSTLKPRGHGDEMNPLRDWAIGLFLAVLMFLAGVAYIAHDFYSQFGQSNTQVVAEAQTVVYRDAEVKSFAEEYATKEKMFNALRSNVRYEPPAPILEESEDTEEEVTEPLADNPTSE